MSLNQNENRNKLRESSSSLTTSYDVKQVKPYSLSELSMIYGISPKTLGKWLVPFKKEIGKRQGRFYNVLQVEIIFNRLGLPYRIVEQ